MRYEEVNSLAEQVRRKWNPILEHPDLTPINDTYKKNVTAILLENQEQYLSETPTNSGMQQGMISSLGGAATAQQGAVQSFDPVLISLVRRSMPNLIAYDICGVQPMTGPTGLIFAMKSNYVSAAGARDAEALFNEARTGYATSSAGKTTDALNLGITSGSMFGYGAAAVGDPFSDFVHGGITTAQAEALGASNKPDFQEMSFSIERTAVQAKTRALKAEYSTELAQDLRAVHGLDAETELANILSTEILSEINREVVRTILKVAKLGCQQTDLFQKGSGVSFGQDAGGGVGGVYDILRDSDGRWSAERFRGLLFQIEREANQIAKETRRGKGNIVICSSDVAAALALSGSMQSTPMGGGSLQVDDTGNTFVGTINGRLKVYIDPYADFNYCVVGYKGSSQYDAGLFYCPYVPLQMVRAVGENTFQPKIGFKTRYGMVSNPFVLNRDTGAPDGENLYQRSNQYYRVFRVDNLHGINSGQGATQ